MEIFNSVWDVISSFLLLILSFVVSIKIGSRFYITDKFSILIYIWHTVFCFIYLWFSLTFGADAVAYYNKASGIDVGFNVGTEFIVWLTYFLRSFLNLSYLSCFLIFNFIGYIGLLAFAGTLKLAVQNRIKNIKYFSWLIIFLPSISFWSTGLGKDPISFMATGLALWASLNFKKRIFTFIFAVVAMLMVRPHMAAVMLAAYALAFVFDKRVSVIQRFLVGIVAIILSGFMIPFAMQYAGLGDAQNTADVEEYIDQRQGYNLEGGSSVDISSMSLPMQLFTYLFRPLPFEANSIFTLAASLDNIILLFLAIMGILAIIKKSKPSVESNRAFLWLYVFMAWLIFATTTANLGIAMRQKWMFAPMLIFLLLSVIGTRKVNNEKVTNVIAK